MSARAAIGPSHAAARRGTPLARIVAPAVVSGVAAILYLIARVGFANYDSLYAMVWGQQLGRGELPQYGLPIAPTPHPLVELVGLVLAPLGPGAAEDALVALGFVALAATGVVVYRLGEAWFGRAAGLLAALILLTRVPVLSYGVRAYVDIPSLLFVLGALLVETRRPRAGAPVLALLGLAGLLRPEAWAFAGLYWLCLARWGLARRELVALGLLAAAAPLLWLLSDLLVTGDPLWSLTNTRHTAHTLARVTGIGHVPLYIPRRIGEVVRPPVLAGAAIGGVLTLAWTGERARLGAAAGVIAVAVFALFAAAGLPINTRYAFLASAVLCLFCAAGVLGWLALPREDPRRRWWMAAGALIALALLAYAPAQYRSADGELDSLSTQQQIQDDLVALVASHAITLRCGPVGVPNHRPVPLLALRLRTRPSHVVDAQAQAISRGTYVDPASAQARDAYTLDAHDPHPLLAAVPAGFALAASDRSWRVFTRCP